MYENLSELNKECAVCTKCALCEKRINVVAGYGHPNSDIMFIGEGPGQNEDIEGKPFVGRAGKLLDKFLSVIDLDRSKDIYITNIVKCRPPNNRDPLPEEQDTCTDNWLSEQIRIINPKIIVCLGRIAAMRLISKDIKITKDHGVFFNKDNIIIMSTLHPAALLRNPSQKPSCFEDFLKLRDKISELRTQGIIL